ncbi:VgrG protein [hydrothermal vent metagenome]|uniref:VgrG protein n=1 Tax=hydrothermal vent metagenome TaxID=652676 RepID=A0A3B0XDG2_9ZZZZ
MSQITQKNRTISLTAPLGDDELLLSSMSGTEYISELFEFQLEVLSENQLLKARKIIGKSVTVNIHDSNGRFFNGYVSELRLGGIVPTGDINLRQYNLTIVPWLWFLSKRSNCRIFQNKTAVNIIEEIFKEHDIISQFKMNLSEKYKKREYCVQFNESDLDFVIRLMEEEGIAYYFEHEKKKHTLVMVDQKNSYCDCREKEVLFTRGGSDREHINSWDHQYAFCGGKRTQRDYNFKNPEDKLEFSTPTLVKLPLNANLEQYNYPGYHEMADQGEQRTKNRMLGEELAHSVIEASSNCSSFYAGGVFEIKEHECESEKGRYILVSVSHHFHDDSYYAQDASGADYNNSFMCIPGNVHFSPLPSMIKPVMKGPQTAIVVGSKGEEIEIDKYGRVKVQFHWDREGRYDEKSSCWIRVAQAYAGNKWGTQITPRIGQEVIVSFLDGDPDRPIITGSVYNNDNMPPYPQAKKTQHGIKSHSTLSGGPKNFNELRFDDKKGSEEVFIQAEKDYRRLIKNDEKSEIKANHYMKVAKTSKTKAQSVTIEATDFIELKVGGSSIKLTSTGILIKATKIDVKGSAMVVVKGGLIKLN